MIQNTHSHKRISSDRSDIVIGYIYEKLSGRKPESFFKNIMLFYFGKRYIVIGLLYLVKYNGSANHDVARFSCFISSLLSIVLL